MNYLSLILFIWIFEYLYMLDFIKKSYIKNFNHFLEILEKIKIISLKQKHHMANLIKGTAYIFRYLICFLYFITAKIFYAILNFFFFLIIHYIFQCFYKIITMILFHLLSCFNWFQFILIMWMTMAASRFIIHKILIYF